MSLNMKTLSLINNIYELTDKDIHYELSKFKFYLNVLLLYKKYLIIKN